jgi:hypothetical protein
MHARVLSIVCLLFLVLILPARGGSAAHLKLPGTLTHLLGQAVAPGQLATFTAAAASGDPPAQQTFDTNTPTPEEITRRDRHDG